MAESRAERRRSQRWLLLGILLLALLMIPAARPYLQTGYQVAHDRTTPFLRVEALTSALAQGQIPPRWFPQFDGGYGSPYPSFYGMGFYYAAALFQAAGLPVGDAVELTAFAVLAISGLGMFFLARHLWGAPAGLLSAGLYVYAPYHLVDAFVRGAYSELTAFVWFPLIPLCMLLWRDTGRRGWILAGGVSVAGLVISHNIMPMIFLPAMPLFAGAILIGRKASQSVRRSLAGWSMMAFLGALLSAYFWMPVILDKGLIHAEYFLQNDYHDDFVGFSRLLTTAVSHGLTTEVGIPLLLAVVSAVTAALLSRRLAETRRLILAAGILALGYLFMTNFRSDLIWSRIKVLSFVQFPWRMLAPADFFLSFVAGALAVAPSRGRWRWGVALLLPAVAVAVHHPLIRIPQTVTRRQVDSLVACQEVWGTQDYRPHWSAAAFWNSPDPPPPTAGRPVLPACQGGITISPSQAASSIQASHQGLTWTVRYSASQDSVIEIPQFFYPTWRATIDSVVAAAAPSASTGLLSVRVPAGEHTLVARLGRTSAQAWGLAVSAASLIALFLVGLLWPLLAPRLGRTNKADGLEAP